MTVLYPVDCPAITRVQLRADALAAQEPTMATTRPRYCIRKARSGWYVEDTHTGRVWTGLVHAGAIQLANHLNRRNP